MISINVSDTRPVPKLVGVHITQNDNGVTSTPTVDHHRTRGLLLSIVYCAQRLTGGNIALFNMNRLKVTGAAPTTTVIDAVANQSPRRIIKVNTGLPASGLTGGVSIIHQTVALGRPGPRSNISILTGINKFSLIKVTNIVLNTTSYNLPILLSKFLSCTTTLTTYRVSPTVGPCLVPSRLSTRGKTHVTLSRLKLRPCLGVRVHLNRKDNTTLTVPVVRTTYTVCGGVNRLTTDGVILPKGAASSLGDWGQGI